MKIMIFVAMLTVFEFIFALWIPLIVFLLIVVVIGFIIEKLKALDNKVRTFDTLVKTLERKVQNLNNLPKIPVKKILEPSLPEIDKLKDEIDELKREIELKVKLKVRINELKNEVELLKNKLKEDIIPSEVVFQNRQEQQFYPAPRREVLYFSTPNEDGSFNEKFAHFSYRQDASIYKLIKTSVTEAEFQINDSESSVKLALEYPDKNIDTVCEAQNAFHPKASRIVTVQGGLGKAVLDGDKWKVTKKAKIKYEH